MKTGDAINKMHRRYAGDTKYPIVKSDTWQMYLDILNERKNTWATDPDNKWESCFEERTFGTASSDLQYDLDDDVDDLSDFVYIDIPDGRTVAFTVIKEKDRHDPTRTKCVYLSSSDPKTLNFTMMPAACIGGTVRAGVYFVPPDMKTVNSIVPVDRPMWAILDGAAELSFNDPSKEDKAPDLFGFANDEYAKMVSAAQNLPANQPNTTPTIGFEQLGGCG